MADKKHDDVKQSQPVSEHQRYDIRNPTRARRVIYDGISSKPITIEGGATVRSVLLHADIVKELRDRNKVKENSELLTKLSEPEKSDA